MASHKLMCITAALLILEGYGVYGQAFGASASATEFVNQGVSQTYTQAAATAAVPAPTAQFVIPAVIKPIFQETIYPQPAPMPSFPTYPPTFPPPPPVIITDDSDDMHPLLLLMLLMNSANGGNNGYTGGYGGCGCGGNGGCNGGCGGYNGGCGCNGGYGNGGYGNGGYGNGGCGCNVYSNNYTPYPINVPGGPYYPPIAETPCACAYGNDVIIQGPGPVVQACNRPMPNEINLIISAAPCNCSSSS